MLPSMMRLMEDGHQMIGIFSFQCDNVFNFNTECQNLAGRLNIPFIQSPANESHLQNFIDQGGELFIAAGYPHKIPDIKSENAYAVNIHPTYLPQGRGLMPIPEIIINNIETAAGFTAHKMTQEFDAGDILLQQKIALQPDETVETYSAKIALKAPDLISNLAANLPDFWQKAKPQSENKATHFKAPSDDDRVMQWDQTVEEIDRVGRAFGRYGSLAPFDEQIWVVYDYDCWVEKHDLPAGTIAARLSREVLITAKNGFILLKDFYTVQA